MTNALKALAEDDSSPTHKAHQRFWLFLILLLAGISALFGESSKRRDFHPRLRPSMAHMSWTPRDGTPSHVAALARTMDGYLWIGSPLGLYRFNGAQFAAYPVTSLDTPLPASDVESLAADQQGGLWIGFRLGGMSYLSRDGTVSDYNRQNGRGPGEVQKLLCRADGSVWALGDGRLMLLQYDRWEDFGKLHGLPRNELFSFYFDRKGDLWVSARQHVSVLRRGEATFKTYAMKSFAVVDFVETPDGRLWVSDAWHSVHPLGPGTPHISIATEGLARLAVEASGTIWLAQDYRGVLHVSASDPTSVTKESAVSEQTEAVLGDRSGNIWVGSSRGLDRFRPSALQSLTGLRLEYYPSLAADPAGGVWVATLKHPLLHISGSKVTAVGPPVGSSPVVSDDHGHVWLIDPVLHDLVHYNGSKILRIPNPKETDQVVAQSIGLDRDGAPLVDFLSRGLWRYDGAWSRVHDTALPDGDVLAMLRDAAGRVWLGFADSQIVMRDAAGFHAFPVCADADIGNVLSFMDAEGTIWAGGTNGVSYFSHGEFHKIRLRSDTPLRGVSGIVEDKSHNLWLNARAGIVRIEAAQLRESFVHSEAPLDFEVLDEQQGLLGYATQLKPTPSAMAEADGTLVFATDGNVLLIDPEKVSFRRSLPSVMTEAVAVNGSVVMDREHAVKQIKLNAGSLRDLEIDYAGIDFASPEKIHYRYMLDGEDTGWQNAGSRRQAFYSHLRPGTYHFRLTAGSDDKAMAELFSPLLFTVTPAFYQTASFDALCSLLVLSLLYVAYLLRVRLVTRRLKERLRVRASERIRIARELHDTLLQSVQGLMLRFHFATEALPPDEPARQSLLLAVSLADDVISEGRRRVKDLRDEIPEELHFTKKLAKIVSELEIQEAIKFQLVEHGRPRELRRSVQVELCRVAREALNNTVRHSGATRAEIALSYGSSDFVMRCYDNGVGLAPAILSHGKREGHWGLVGMQERAAVIEGKLQLRSVPGRGTEIEIRIPGRLAYRHSSGRARWLHRVSQLRRHAEGDAS